MTEEKTKTQGAKKGGNLNDETECCCCEDTACASNDGGKNGRATGRGRLEEEKSI